MFTLLPLKEANSFETISAESGPTPYYLKGMATAPSFLPLQAASLGQCPLSLLVTLPTVMLMYCIINTTWGKKKKNVLFKH